MFDARDMLELMSGSARERAIVGVRLCCASSAGFSQERNGW